jgi:hypothetical protein
MYFINHFLAKAGSHPPTPPPPPGIQNPNKNTHKKWRLGIWCPLGITCRETWKRYSIYLKGSLWVTVIKPFLKWVALRPCMYICLRQGPPRALRCLHALSPRHSQRISLCVRTCRLTSVILYNRNIEQEYFSCDPSEQLAQTSSKKSGIFWTLPCKVDWVCTDSGFLQIFIIVIMLQSIITRVNMTSWGVIMRAKLNIFNAGSLRDSCMSRHTAVCLSPTISFWWPRPLGTGLSTAVNSVCICSFTNLRSRSNNPRSSSVYLHPRQQRGTPR